MAEAKDVKKEVKPVKVEPVYGPMVHLLLDKPINGITAFEDTDAWLQAQIDAGKLKVVG